MLVEAHAARLCSVRCFAPPHILWFEVAVNDFCLVEHGERVEQLFEEGSEQRPAETSVTVLLLKEQNRAIDQRERKSSECE